MIKISVDEAFAFDYLSILKVKNSNGASNKAAIEQCETDIQDCIGSNLFSIISQSEEYRDLYSVNYLTFLAVDKAKKDEVKASEVDALNYKRYLSKKALQDKFFSKNTLSETKIGYEQI